jgi:hypothetical protein
MPIRRLLLIVAIITFSGVLFTSSVTAQDDRPDCNPADLITQAAALISAGDDEKDLTALLELSQQISAENIACNGFKFEGANAKLIGPFDLPDGLYKTTVTTTGYFAAKLKVLSGKCDTGGRSTLLYNLSDGNADTGAEAMLQSEGCRLVIQTENVSEPWTLTIEPLK